MAIAQASSARLYVIRRFAVAGETCHRGRVAAPIGTDCSQMLFECCFNDV